MPKAERVESVSIIIALTLQEAHDLKKELWTVDRDLGGIHTHNLFVMDAILEQLGHFALPDDPLKGA